VTQRACEPASACSAVDCAMRIPASFVAATSLPTVEAGLRGRTVPIDPRLDAIDRWGAALAQHDDAEVDRLVRKSRAARVEDATAGRFGIVLGQLDPTSPSRAVE
jgi:hypothetical protein